jgi:hypothetical protein
LSALQNLVPYDPAQLVGIPFALAGAVFMSVGAQLQHAGVGRVSRESDGIKNSGLSIKQLATLMSRPSWLLGTIMLGLAVGIDYALFVLNRHRRQLKSGMGMRESIALANGTSGSAVLFAGLTVIIALLALNLTGIGFLGLMGTIGAGAIAISVLSALTFTPALMHLFGLKLLNRKERAVRAQILNGEMPEVKPKAAARAKKEIWAAKRPLVALALTIGVLAVAAIPFGSMRLGLSDGSSEPVDSTQYQAFALTSDAFGAGQNGQITAAVSFDRVLTGDDLLRTKAVKQGDGSYKISGTKVFISAGEHDLSENIVHLVLARIEGAPAGIRVNCVAPGMTATEAAVSGWEKRGYDAASTARQAFSLGRYGEMREVSQAIVFFASDAASYITGETLAVGGGAKIGGMISVEDDETLGTLLTKA